MGRKDEQGIPSERGAGTPNEPPVDPRKPPATTTPGSHTTGGARDHRSAEDSEGPSRR